jgi:DNA invertase Pin-like site-specific DNA recombinase
VQPREHRLSSKLKDRACGNASTSPPPASKASRGLAWRRSAKLSASASAKPPGKLVSEFTEVKSGRKSARPELKEALRICRMRRAVLLIARLDRLARNVALVSSLMKSDIEFVAVDFPQASRLTLHVLAAIAEHESRIISKRVKASLAVAKARGVKLGGGVRGLQDMSAAVAASKLARCNRTRARAMDLAPIVWDLRAKGRSLTEIARELNRQGIATARYSLRQDVARLKVVVHAFVDDIDVVPRGSGLSRVAARPPRALGSSAVV